MSRRKRSPSPSEQVSRAKRAKRELPAFDEACVEVRHYLLEAIAETGLHDTAGREKLYMATQLLPMLRSMLEAAINDGTAADFSAQIQAMTSDQKPN